MNLFQCIVERLVNIDNNSNMFCAVYRIKPDNVSALHKITFQRLLSKLHPCSSGSEHRRMKMEFFYETIHDFYFSSNHKERNTFITCFGKVQSVYHTLHRFLFLYKWKKAKIRVTTDLQLNEIDTRRRNVICIFHANSKFLFRLEDLLKIVYTSLTNTYYFFSEPLTIKNPYNNLPFSKSILYYIHYYVVTYADISYIKYDHLNVFLKFKQLHFNLSRFIDMNTSVLRDYAIQNYITHSTKGQLYNDIVHFIQQYNLGKDFSNKILIDVEFPVDNLVDIMKPYLSLYIQSTYALTVSAQQKARQTLYTKLKQFQIFNPCFGKRNIVFKYVVVDGIYKRVKSHIEFNSKHCSFAEHKNSHFLSNHETYTYDEENDAMQGDIGNIYND